MSDRLEKQLKEFEKELSLLLVQFMRIADEVAQSRAGPAVSARTPPRAGAQAAPLAAGPRTSGASASSELVAYA